MIVVDADESLLARFHAGIYMDAFAARVEPLAAWQRALRGDAPYSLRVQVALEGDEFAGGICFERYPRSGCGLVTYLVVAPGARRRGLGKGLLDGALAQLADARAVFGETEDPSRFLRWGARIVDVPYVQPSLGPGLPRGTGLVLIDFTGRGDRGSARAFAEELYAVTEGRAPEPW